MAPGRSLALADGLHHTFYTTPMTSLPQIPSALQSNIKSIPQQTEDETEFLEADNLNWETGKSRYKPAKTALVIRLNTVLQMFWE